MNEQTELTNPLDDAPADAMEDIFVLPETMANDPRIARWYEEMVARLRREAQGVPMKTAQYTLMERIAYFYAVARYNELTMINQTARDVRENNAAWLSMLDQFNRLLEKHNDKVVNEMIMEIQKILHDSLSIITDDRERAALRRHLQEEFANINL